jgi:hypothetical protein
LRPKKPTMTPLCVTTGGIELFLIVVIILTVVVVRGHTTVSSAARVTPAVPKSVAGSPQPIPSPPSQSRLSANSHAVPTKVPSRTEAGVGPIGSGRADLKIEFVGRDHLQFMYFADSRESANEPKRFFGLWDINHPFFYHERPGVVQALPLAFKTEMDFVFHNSRQGPMDIIDTPQAIAHVKPGDRLFGLADVMCLNCDRERSYWVYFEVGVGGWYAEMEKPPWGGTIQVPKPEFSNEQQDAVLDAQVPREKRIVIPER